MIPSTIEITRLESRLNNVVTRLHNPDMHAWDKNGCIRFLNGMKQVCGIVDNQTFIDMIDECIIHELCEANHD